MVYEEEENGVAGRVPEVGAIFMSNITTKRECFRRKVFGLPSAQANFVKQVKTGMVLFLFEFERRELFGVFRACSDGTMNIVPHAFSSSGNQFPAQVRFTTDWYCNPLSENEFRDVIRDNYFSAKKFNFGLSEDQVRRLLWLFSSRKLKNRLPQRQLTREVTRPVGKDSRRVDDDRFLISDRVENEPDVGNCLGPAILSEDPGYSLDKVKRVDDDRFLMVDRVENEHNVKNNLGQGIGPDYAGNSWGEIRRMNNYGRFLKSDETENECYDDHGIRHTIWNEYIGDSLGKVRRVADSGQFITGDRVENESTIDYNLGPVISTEYPGNSFDKVRGLANDGMSLMRERVGNECNLDSGFGSVISTDRLMKPLGKVSLATDDRFLMNDSVVNGHNMDNGLGSVSSTECLGDLLGKVRRVTDDSRFPMNDRIQKECYVDNGIGPVISTEHLGSPLIRVRATDDGRFLINERVETEHFGNPLGKVRMETDDRRFLIRKRVENEHNVENSLGPAFSDEYSGYALGEDRLAADAGRCRESDTVENRSDMDNCLRPIISTEYTAFQSKQNPFIYSSKPILERRSSAFPHPSEQQIFNPSYPTPHDAIVTRAVPYDPEVPNICDRRSSPFTGDHSSSSVQDCPPYHSSEGNIFSLSKNKLSPYYLEPKGLSRCLDVASDCVNKAPFPITSNRHGYPCSVTSNSFPNAGYSENRALESSAHEGYKGPLFLEPLSSMPFSKGEIYVKENRGPFSYAFSSSENSSFAFDDGYPVASQGKYKHEISWHENSETFTARDLSSSDASRCHLQYSACCSEPQVIYSHEKDSIRHDNEYYKSSEGKHSDSKKNRTSVFARLTSAPEVHVQEQENDTPGVYDEYDRDASVDEVMDMLHQGQNQPVKKMRQYKPLVREHDDDEIARIKRQTAGYNEIEYDYSTMITPRMEMDANTVIEEIGDQILKETRVVDFKRRSEIRKNLDETCRKGSVGIEDGKTSVEDAEGEGLVSKHGKRRKLVRPVFGKKVSSDEGFSNYNTPSLQLPSQKSSLGKGNTVSCKDFENNMSSENVGFIHVMHPTTSD